jgi:hypothetical protein
MNRKIQIITNENDNSILMNADKLNADIFFYSRFKIQDGQLFYEGNLFKAKCLVLRGAYIYDEGKYQNIFEFCLKKYADKIILDKCCYVKYPNFEDKLWQVEMFRKLSIPHPKTIREIKDFGLLKFPLVIKKRISSCGMNNFVINDAIQILNFDKNFLDRCIFQEFVDFY